jgi:hypothetical protein
MSILKRFITQDGAARGFFTSCLKKSGHNSRFSQSPFEHPARFYVPRRFLSHVHFSILPLLGSPWIRPWQADPACYHVSLCISLD